MGTGEGKSIVIAMLAVFMAKLHGLKVRPYCGYTYYGCTNYAVFMAKLHGLKVIEG